MSIRHEDGYELWLRYRPVDNAERLAQYRQAISSAAVLGRSPELVRAIFKLEGDH